MTKQKIFLFLIVILAFTLRFYNLGSYPALNADEASIGYDAYSLIKTGHDQHRNPWPVQFQSFNDYKPGLYVYIILPLVKLIGLNAWSVRIPSAFIGVLTVVVLYFLTKKLFKNIKVATIAALLLAISPWHIHFSRGGWEVNVSTFFITLGLILFLTALENSKLRTFMLSALSFVLALYAYHSARVIVPLLGLGLTVIYFKEIKKNLKLVLVSGTIFVILCIPLLNKTSLSRATGVSIFSDQGIISGINEQRGEGEGTLLTKVLHNKFVNYSLAFSDNWGKHFWGEFLFLSGDIIQRNRVPETGQLYGFEIITVAVGVAIMIKKMNKEHGVIFYWLLIAPAAAALTFQSPHALRAHNMVIPLTLVSAYGVAIILEYISNKIPKKNFQVVVFSFIFLIGSWSVVRYLHEYYNHMSQEYPYSSQYGVKELVSYLSNIQNKDEKIFITTRYDQPYILYLFYTKTDPAYFQTHHQLTQPDNFGFSTVADFDNIHFGAINFKEIQEKYPNSIIIGDTHEIPKEANIVKKIYGPNGFLYFQIVRN